MEDNNLTIYGPHLSDHRRKQAEQLRPAAGNYSLDEELALARLVVLQTFEAGKLTEMVRALVAVAQLQKARKELDSGRDEDIDEAIQRIMQDEGDF